MRNRNSCTLTNKRTVLLTCDLHKHILVLFEMLPYCESELIPEETATLRQFKALFGNKANDQQVWKRMTGVWITMLRRSISVQDWALTMPHMVAVVCGSGDVALVSYHTPRLNPVLPLWGGQKQTRVTHLCCFKNPPKAAQTHLHLHH